MDFCFRQQFKTLDLILGEESIWQAYMAALFPMILRPAWRFLLSKKPWRDQSQDLRGARATIKAGQERLQVALTQIPVNASADDILKLALPFAQEFLDLLAVQAQLAYRIVDQDDCVIWRRTAGFSKLQINITVPMSVGMNADPQVILPNGSINPAGTVQSPNVRAAFRYYRFSASAADLFEAYRYLYLCLESGLDDLFPKRPNDSERRWLADALRKAMSRYSLDLSAFSQTGRDAVGEFIEKHYVATRCATFHAKAGAFVAGRYFRYRRGPRTNTKTSADREGSTKKTFRRSFPDLRNDFVRAEFAPGAFGALARNVATGRLGFGSGG